MCSQTRQDRGILEGTLETKFQDSSVRSDGFLGLTSPLSKSKRFTKGNHPCAKKETGWFGRFYLFRYHILSMLDILKQLKHLHKFLSPTRNSEFSFACDSLLLFRYLDLPDFSGGDQPLWVINYWKPQRRFLKSSSFEQDFSSHKPSGLKVPRYTNNKNLVLLVYTL